VSGETRGVELDDGCLDRLGGVVPQGGLASTEARVAQVSAGLCDLLVSSRPDRERAGRVVSGLGTDMSALRRARPS
jgi:hypothetical protein